MTMVYHRPEDKYHCLSLICLNLITSQSISINLDIYILSAMLNQLWARCTTFVLQFWVVRFRICLLIEIRCYKTLIGLYVERALQAPLAHKAHQAQKAQKESQARGALKETLVLMVPQEQRVTEVCQVIEVQMAGQGLM